MEDYPNEEHIVQILETENVTHNVKRFKLSKPDSYKFKPGQATDIVINLPAWKEERRPFTFTSLNDWDNLEFTIKIYDDHNGVTNELGKLRAGDELILHDVFRSEDLLLLPVSTIGTIWNLPLKFMMIIMALPMN